MVTILIFILIAAILAIGGISIVHINRKQNNKLFSVISITKKLQLLAKRFPITILLVIGLAVLFFIGINDSFDTISYRLWIFFPISIFISLTVTLFAEDFWNYLKTHLLSILFVLLWGIYSILLPKEDQSLTLSKWIEICVIGGTFFFGLFFITSLGKNKDRTFWNFSGQVFLHLILAAVFGAIFFGGLSLALSAIESLFNISIDSETYVNLSVCCFALLSPVYFLANIPYKEEKYRNEISYSKPQKVLALYILTPILAVYTIILYAYLFKIIIAWELPNGWVSWLVSALALGGLAVISILYPIREQTNHKIVNFISRWMILFILPLLTLMSIGIFRRIGDYGITINRGYILILNIWFYGIYIYLFLTHSRHIKWILISPVVIALLTSISIWGVADVTKTALTKEVAAILTKKVSLEEAQNIFAEMKQEKRERIRSVFKYLLQKFGKESVQIFFTDTISNNSWELLSDLNLKTAAGKKTKNISYYTRNEEKTASIKKYNFFMKVEYSKYKNKSGIVNYSLRKDTLNISTGSNTFAVPIRKISMENLKSGSKKELIITGNNYKLLLNNFYGTYFPEKDSIYIRTLNGYLFYNTPKK